jgi:flagellar protein FliJ
MSTSHKSLKTLQDLAHTRVDEATKHLGELIASKQASEVKLAMLQDYRKEYRERFLQSARNGIEPNAWRNYSAFLEKLDEAIAAQQLSVNHSQKATEHGQKKWVSESTRAKAFDTLTDRHKQNEQRRQNKLEQVASDEHSSNTFRKQQEEGGN